MKYYAEMRENHIERLEKETYHLVADFCILWNLFEKNICGRSFNKKYISDIITRIKENENTKADFESMYFNIKKYNSQRYYNCSHIYDAYSVRPTDMNKTEFDKKYNSDEVEDKIEIAVILCYRIRNNMFHGIKEICELNDQKILFLNINCLLSLMLSCYLHF